MTRIAFFGDWHGDAEWAARAIAALREKGVTEAFHVGDFGIWPDDQALVRAVDRAAAQANIRVFVTPGNHEWWDRLDNLFAASEGKPVQYSDRISLLPPGHRWVLNDLTCLSFGGAGSIDRDHREEGKDWWPGEDVTDAEVERAIAGGPVDLLISHQVGRECGAAVTQRRQALNAEFSASAVEYASRAECKVQSVVDAVHPRVHVHGHWHVQDEIELPDGRQVYSMGKEWQPGNVSVFDTTTFAWEWVPLFTSPL